MNKEDPFASQDSERTIRMPSPGGRIPPSMQSAQHWQTSEYIGPIIGTDKTIAASGINPLVAAANPLLNIVPQIRNTLQHENLSGLHDHFVQHIKIFETRSKTASIPPEKIMAARYVLCTLLDETIANTPWGSGEWGKHSLLAKFHNEAAGGEKFFLLLKKLIENPKENRNLLELMDICLALGFAGRYRLMDNGKAHLETLREQLTQLLKKEQGGYERDLSPHWYAALHKPAKAIFLLPLWILTALCGLILLATYMSFNHHLSRTSDPVFSKIASIDLGNPVSTPHIPVTSSSAVPLLSEFLFKEKQDGLVTVHDENGHSVITLLGKGLFASGSTAVSQDFVPILSRIADALNSIPGRVLVTGHTDNQPITLRSVRFRDNWQLSQERAHSVMQILIDKGVPANRLRAEGQADTEPIASNSTPEGRARNRRVEITLSTPAQTSSSLSLDR